MRLNYLFLVILALVRGERQGEIIDQYGYIYPHPPQFPPPPQDNYLPAKEADDRTIMSDIIGFSALKFMMLFALPMIFSIFLGGMLVLLFPFPLITSTSGLAGAAAVGRRRSGGKSAEEILQYIHTTPTPKKKKKMRSYHHEELCVGRLACEIGKENKDLQTLQVIQNIIEELPPKSEKRWRPAIKGYLDGVQSQGVPFAREEQKLGPIYRHNLCLKYKCSL